MTTNDEIKIEKPGAGECPVDLLVMLQNSVTMLREMTEVQCNHGNWDFDPYMHGMANGMIFALSLFDNKRPEYLEAPDKWGNEDPDLSEPLSGNGG